MLLRSLTVGLLGALLYFTVAAAHAVHIRTEVIATPAPPRPAVAAIRVVDITAAAAASPHLFATALALQPGERIVALDFRRPVLASGDYLDLTIADARGAQHRVLVLVH